MNTPLLLIVWRRPHTLRQVINAIRPVAPSQIFVACDGPNPDRPGEAAKVAATRAMIDTEIDWTCRIERLYSDVNQGCRLGVSRAISWFFEQVEEGIILEDDCVPHPDFFPYCTTLLERYRHDTRVWCISGTNVQDGQWRGDGSYYFSRYNHCWGWASWRRCWSHYDPDLSNWPKLRDSTLWKSVFDDSVERQYWTSIYQTLLQTGRPNTWDYQWTFTCLANRGLTALPNCNLISNIGYGDDATHTTNGQGITMTSQNKFDVNQHPSFVLRDIFADCYTFNEHYGGKWRRVPFSFLRLAKRLLDKFLRS